MSNEEYEILDELYFISQFDRLLGNLNMEEESLKELLIVLYKKGWLRILEDDSEKDVENLDFFHKNYKKYHYLASKAGLLVHNSR